MVMSTRRVSNWPTLSPSSLIQRMWPHKAWKHGPLTRIYLYMHYNTLFSIHPNCPSLIWTCKIYIPTFSLTMTPHIRDLHMCKYPLIQSQVPFHPKAHFFPSKGTFLSIPSQVCFHPSQGLSPESIISMHCKVFPSSPPIVL
jgi:hypothetical protein